MKRKSSFIKMFFPAVTAVCISGVSLLPVASHTLVYAQEGDVRAEENAGFEDTVAEENDDVSDISGESGDVQDGSGRPEEQKGQTNEDDKAGSGTPVETDRETAPEKADDDKTTAESSSGISATSNIYRTEKAIDGWVHENGNYYYYKNSSKYTGWHYMTRAEGEKNPHWSFFGDDGRLRTGWVRLGRGTANPDGNSAAHWSYFGDNGWLRTGWVQLGKGTSNPDGNTARHWSYFGDNGWLRTGWVQLGRGTSNPDGDTARHWSYFGDNGWLRTGWVQLGRGTSNPDGNTARHWSYFGGDGWMRTGWQDMGQGTSNPDGNSKRHKSYFGDNGWLRTGLQRIDGNTYSFDDKGWLLDQDMGMLNKAQGYSSSTGYLILVDRSKCKTAIFTGNYGNWKYDKYWSCCVGAPSTPTITGVYHLGIKALYFDTGDYERCWYKSQISGSYLFHSVLYYRDSGPYKISDGTMGAWVSHGCIRLDIQNAKYIYDVVPSGTTIVIYN